MEAILLSIALDQEKRLDAVEKVLQNAGVLCEIASRMDSRPLPQSERDDTVADRPEPVALTFDRYGRKKYAAMLHEAFEPFVLCAPKRAEPILLRDPISEEDLDRFPLFSALATFRL